MSSGLETEWYYSGRMGRNEKGWRSKKRDEVSKKGKRGKVRDTTR